MALKDNHKNLLEEVRLIFDWIDEHPFDERKRETYENWDHSHGRRVFRRCTVINEIGRLDEEGNWKGLKTIVRVESIRKHLGKTSREVRYYLSSHSGGAKKHLSLVRGHWGIENKLHWVPDVVFDEDRCRTRKDHAPENLALMRKLALNVLRQDTDNKKSLRMRRFMAGLQPSYASSLVATSRS